MQFLFLGVVKYLAATCFPLALGVEAILERGLAFPFPSTNLWENEEITADLETLDFEGFGGAESGHCSSALENRIKCVSGQQKQKLYLGSIHLKLLIST